MDGAEDADFQPPFSGCIQQILHRQTTHVIAAVKLPWFRAVLNSCAE
ncbi:hypothetical protein SSMOSELEY_3380 [Shigella sonnei str. Moseley]|nr:hypothetical protein SSMOSELEY_3380 [Shigella sonnei str. Moseley]